YRLVDAAICWVCRVELPPSVELHKRQSIRGVAVHLVRGREDEDRLGGMATGALEQRESAVGVHREVCLWIGGGPIVRRLGRGVHDERVVFSVPCEQRFHRDAITNIRRDVPIPRVRSLQPLAYPRG